MGDLTASVFHRDVPGPASGSRDIKLKHHIHAGGLVRLEGPGNILKNTGHCQSPGLLGCRLFFLGTEGSQHGAKGSHCIGKLLCAFQGFYLAHARRHGLWCGDFLPVSHHDARTGDNGGTVVVAHARIVNSSGPRTLLAAEIEHQGRHKFRFELFEQLRRQDIFGKPGSGNRGNGIHLDIMLVPFDPYGVHKSQKTHLGR